MKRGWFERTKRSAATLPLAMTLALIEMARQSGVPPSETLSRDTIVDEQAKLREVG